VVLSSRDRTRYARQLLLPQLGEAGQVRLLAATLHVGAEADAGALAVARSYLERAGVRVLDPSGTHDAALQGDSAELLVATVSQIDGIAGEPVLREAARALAGALAAVGAIQTLAGLTGVVPALQRIAISSEEA